MPDLSDPISVDDFDALPAELFAYEVGWLFEDAPRFLARLERERPFGSPETMFQSARDIALAMPEIEQLELVDAHPRLGAKPSELSPASFGEQGHATQVSSGWDPASRPERERVAGELQRLNDAYEARFGFRYCVFVAGRTRAELLPGFEAALQADRSEELRRALIDVVRIAEDRYRKANAEA